MSSSNVLGTPATHSQACDYWGKFIYSRLEGASSPNLEWGAESWQFSRKPAWSWRLPGIPWELTEECLSLDINQFLENRNSVCLFLFNILRFILFVIMLICVCMWACECSCLWTIEVLGLLKLRYLKVMAWPSWWMWLEVYLWNPILPTSLYTRPDFMFYNCMQLEA